jgi:hypothetical protein
MLLQGVWVLVLNIVYGIVELTSGAADQYVGKDAEEVEVEVWMPSSLPSDRPPVKGAPGHWKKTAARVKMSRVKRPTGGEGVLRVGVMVWWRRGGGTKGAMRDVFNLFDANAHVFSGQNKKRLVCKRYVRS